MDKILNYFGTDKVLHFLVGAVIAFIVTNVVMLQEAVVGIPCIAMGVIGLIVAGFAGLVKELIIDSSFDWKDLVATLTGGVLPVATNAVGASFYLLSN